MTCPDYKWCKERLGVDPSRRQHGFEPLCWRCGNFDYEADQRERLKPPEPQHMEIELNQQAKAEITHMHTHIHEMMAKRKEEGLYG